MAFRAVNVQVQSIRDSQAADLIGCNFRPETYRCREKRHDTPTLSRSSLLLLNFLQLSSRLNKFSEIRCAGALGFHEQSACLSYFFTEQRLFCEVERRFAAVPFFLSFIVALLRGFEELQVVNLLLPTEN